MLRIPHLQWDKQFPITQTCPSRKETKLGAAGARAGVWLSSVQDGCCSGTRRSQERGAASSVLPGLAFLSVFGASKAIKHHGGALAARLPLAPAPSRTRGLPLGSLTLPELHVYYDLTL